MRVLVTGAAGFIGYHTAEALLARGDEVVGLDNLNPYYDVALKRARLDRLRAKPGFEFVLADLADRAQIANVFSSARPQRVVHLAAQAGVRYAAVNPHAYVDSNVAGFLNVLEGCRSLATEHLVFASTSSVYGANTRMPYSVHHTADHPVSLYGASKKANEAMAHAYAHLYGFPVTGLRFFTVYGPWGRPDMALFTFTQKILSGEPIEIYNYGQHERDFTYIDDIVEGVIRSLDRPAEANPHWSSDAPDPASSSARYRLYNIGNNQPVSLPDLIRCLEAALAIEAKKVYLPKQPGDVVATYADIDDLTAATGFRPSTPIDVGVRRFVDWYRDYMRA